MLYFVAQSNASAALPVLKLIASRTSPFARKVRIVLAEKKVECQMLEMSAWDAGNPTHAYNPLGKLPVLILDDGTHLYDSRVIVEYIDLVSPVSRLIPVTTMRVRGRSVVPDGPLAPPSGGSKATRPPALSSRLMAMDVSAPK